MAGVVDVPEYDQRGEPFGRVENGNDDMTDRFDMGSFEVQPTTGPACDFDGNGSCDIDDLDLFYLELGGTDPVFNLDDMGVVDNDDLTEWLILASAVDPLGRTFVRGDADFDGSVLGNDFTVLAFNFGGLGGWAQGNFVVDPVPGGGNIDGPDFTALAFTFGFASSRQADSGGAYDGPVVDYQWQAESREEAVPRRSAMASRSFVDGDRSIHRTGGNPAQEQTGEQPSLFVDLPS